MLFLRLWNYIRGYVIIFVEGYFLEKFINMCIHRQIFLWDIKKQNNSAMLLKVSIKGFKLLRPIARKTRCRVRITKKRGLPFVINRYRRRKTFAVGAIVCIILLYVLTSFVWVVEIEGYETIDVQVLTDKLESLGVKPGVLKYGIDTDKVVNEMMLSIRELAWIGITVKGTKVKVSVEEAIKPPELIPKDVPCDIVAAKDGIIKTIIAKNGREMVKPGDTVVKGQLLISGEIPNKNDPTKTRLVHAIGMVNARTWYEERCKVNTVLIEKERTGTVETNYSLVLLTKQIDLFHKDVDFEDYEKVEVRKGISLGEDFVLPFGIIIQKFHEVRKVEREISLEEAKQLAASSAHKDVLARIPSTAQIVDTRTEFKQNEDGTIEAVVIVECIEDIGVTRKIGG